MEINDKQFLSDMKLYFGSLSSRRAMRAYYNVAHSTVVLSNATTPPKGKDAEVEEGDRLTKFAVGELSLHIVKIKDESFWNTFVSVFKLNEVPANEMITIKLAGLLTLLGKCKVLSDLKVEWDGTTLLAALTEYAHTKVVIADYTNDSHITREIRRWYKTTTHIASQQHRAEHSHVYDEFPLIHERKGKGYTISIDFTKFKNSDGTNVFTDVHPRANLIMVDGLTAVALGFLKKIKNDFRMKCYFWVEDHQVQLQSEYSDEHISVLTFRPHMVSYPLPRSIALSSEAITI